MNARIAKTILCFIISNVYCEAFKSGSEKNICKNIRVNCKLLKKKNKNEFYVVKDKVIENLGYIIKDDITNDILYYLKFYHLINDSENSYFYIILYELLNLSFLSKNKEKIKAISLSISCINVISYIILKNIVLHDILHHHH
jgi:hypothetical protein